MKTQTLVIVFILLAAVLVAGCTTEPSETAAQTAEQTKNEVRSESTQLANNYYRYDPELYQQALSDSKVIFLDFHANWCPVCIKEKPSILAAFNEMDYDDVIGFQVHYNDGDTESFDKEITKEYQVAYQHTKVIIDKEGDVALKALNAFKKDDVIQAVLDARS